jgi:uncharacterized membrane protein YeiH
VICTAVLPAEAGPTGWPCRAQSILITLLGGLLLRLLAIRFNWNMPKFVCNDAEH